MPEAALHGSSHYDLPPALAHLQHRRAPRGQFVQLHPLLPARAGAATIQILGMSAASRSARASAESALPYGMGGQGRMITLCALLGFVMIGCLL
jgi:hypothetical protein